MNTQTHLLVACTLFAQALPAEQSKRKNLVRENQAVFVGALLPDLSIFIFFLWAYLVINADSNTIWGELYWTQPWQTLSAISNSIPLIAVITLLAINLKNRVLMVLSLSMLAHIALDLPFHADDAHKHFWPLSDMRFHSSLSYWDANHHAFWVSLFETSLLVTAAIVLWRRFKNFYIKLLCALPAMLHIVLVAYFWLR